MSPPRMPAEPLPELPSADAVAGRAGRGQHGFEDTVPHAVGANPLLWSADAAGPSGAAGGSDADPTSDLEFHVDVELDLDLNLDDLEGAAASSLTHQPANGSADVDFDLDAPVDSHPVAVQQSGGARAAAAALAAVVATTAPASTASVGLLATRPSGSPVAGFSRARRVLVISADSDERVYARTRFAMRRLVWLDESSSTTQAAAAMDDVRYVLALINLDSSVIDAWALAKRFRATHPQALMVATSDTLGPLPLWAWGQRWRAWQLRRQALAAGFDTLLSKPLQGRHIMALVDRLEQAKPPPQAGQAVGR